MITTFKFMPVFIYRHGKNKDGKCVLYQLNTQTMFKSSSFNFMDGNRIAFNDIQY